MAGPRLAALIAVMLAAGCANLPAVQSELQFAAADRSVDPTQEAVELRSWGERIAGQPFLPGNALKLLRDGPATYQAMFQAIGSARSTIDMESYEFDAVEGERFAALLLAKRAQGLRVRLIYDGWGSKDTPGSLVSRLRGGGVAILEYNPLALNSRVGFNPNERDHRKLLIVDGRVVVTGGINIHRVYRNPRRPGITDPELMKWRDTDIRIAGPVATEFSGLFEQSWTLQHGPAIPRAPGFPGSPIWPVGRALVQAVDGTPAVGRPEIYRTLLVAITLAQHQVHLTTGFFVPPPELRQVLQDAALRGVDVRIVVPAHSDSDASIAAGRAHYGELLERGVRIYEREGAVLHAKTAMIDGIWSAIGSSNLDWRSVLFNSEIDAVVLDPPFAAEMETMFQQDVAASREIDLRQWRERPIGQRLREWRSALWERLL